MTYGPNDGFVYFITDGTAVKIGFSAAPERRMADMQIACPRRLRILAKLPGTKDDEALAHGHFRHLRMEGEWFKICDEISHFIKMVKADNETIGNVIRKREATSRVIVSRPAVPEDAMKFKIWADAACVTWPGRLQALAFHAWEGLKTSERAPFDAFCEAYRKEVQVG